MILFFRISQTNYFFARGWTDFRERAVICPTGRLEEGRQYRKRLTPRTLPALAKALEIGRVQIITPSRSKGWFPR
jgi:hypothetical protein